MRSAVLARLCGSRGSARSRGEPAPRALLALRLLNVARVRAGRGRGRGVRGRRPSPSRSRSGSRFRSCSSRRCRSSRCTSRRRRSCARSTSCSRPSVAVLFLDGPRAHWAGLPLGLGTGLMLAGGRSPWPLAGARGRRAAGPSRARVARVAARARAALVFWAGFGAGRGRASSCVQDDAYRTMTAAGPALHPLHSRRASWRRRVASRPSGCGARPAASGGGARDRRSAAARVGSPRSGSDARAQRLVRGRRSLSPGWCCSRSPARCFVSYPQLELEPKHALTAPERVAAVLATMATMFRLSEPNFLLSSSFWVGFGWLDTMPEAALPGRR